VDLVRRHDYLYEYSLGIIGVLKQWLTRAYDSVLAEAGDSGIARLTDQHLKRTAFTAANLLTILNAAQRGEKGFTENAEDVQQLHTQVWSSTPPTQAPIKTAQADGHAESTVPQSQGNLRRGEQKPRRYTTGERARNDAN
jgi:hypothetical protein